MKDHEVIAHQARKIAELEVQVARGLECERQLLGILRRAGIEVTEMELRRDEAEFLRLYRNATSEGKAKIQAKAEAMANSADVSSAKSEDAARVEQDVVKTALKKSSPAKGESVVEGLPSLPKDFFNRPSD